MPLVAESNMSKSQRCMYVALQLTEGEEVHLLKSRWRGMCTGEKESGEEWAIRDFQKKKMNFSHGQS